MKQFSLGREERLLHPSEFKRALQGGRRQSTSHFKIFILPNQADRQRLGITTSRKLGTAVKRNRIKRLLKEFFRLHKTSLPLSSDILFIAKPGADRLSYASLCEELKTVLRSGELS